MPVSKITYKLEVGYKLKHTGADQLQKLIKRNGVSLSWDTLSRLHILRFEFKQSLPFNKAVGRLRESGLNVRFLSSKVDQFYNITPLPAASNCRKL